jgi:hypothetical protein
MWGTFVAEVCWLDVGHLDRTDVRSSYLIMIIWSYLIMVI